MLIALIDDGIDTSLYSGVAVKQDLVVYDDGTIKKRDTSERLLTDHGTACAGIITKYAPKAEFCSLRIFHKEKLTAACKQLTAALIWCYNNKVPLIHMSVGTCFLSDYQSIQPIIAKMISQNQIIVAAHSNHNSFSVPACVGGVFGVESIKEMIEDEYKIISDSIPIIRASSRHQLMSLGGNTHTTPGNVIKQLNSRKLFRRKKY